MFETHLLYTLLLPWFMRHMREYGVAVDAGLHEKRLGRIQEETDFFSSSSFLHNE